MSMPESTSEPVAASEPEAVAGKRNEAAANSNNNGAAGNEKAVQGHPEEDITMNNAPQSLQTTDQSDPTVPSDTDDPTKLNAMATTNPTKDWYPNVSWMTNKERDALASMQLRFSFRDQPFSKVYAALVRAGWTYFGGRRLYLPPDVDKEQAKNPENSHLFMNANEIIEHLDFWSLEDHDENVPQISDLQPISKYHHSINSKQEVPRLIPGQEERWRRLREDFCYHFYIFMLRRDGRIIPDDDDNNNKNNKENYNEENNKNMESDDGKETRRTSKPRRASSQKKKSATKKTTQKPAMLRRSGRTVQNASVTTADGGADTYMNRNSIQAKQKRQKSKLKAKIAAEQEEIPFVRLSLEECAEKVQEFSLEDVEENEAYYKEKHFNEWKFFLGTNHSLLLYGFGSKYNLLNDFAENCLSEEGYALILNGFDPNITAEGILSLLVDMFLDGLEPPPLHQSLPGFEGADATKITKLHTDSTTNELQQITMFKIKDPIMRAKAIAKAIAKKQGQELMPLFLVLHNLEGEGLRNRLAQEILSTLVANCKVKHSGGVNAIRLVASIDHVDAPAVLWNVRTSTQFRWMWQEVHTHRPYVQELVMLEADEIQVNNNKKRRASTGSKRHQKALIMDGEGADRVMEVLRNLATRYTEVMQNLATLQMEAADAAGFSNNTNPICWVDMAQLLQECLNKCTVKSDAQLRTFLDELEDHELVIVQKQGSTSVQVRIPYSDDKLREILSFQPGKNI